MRCPYLETESKGLFVFSIEYWCKLTGIRMEYRDPKVEFVCDAEYGCEYEKCPVYQSR